MPVEVSVMIVCYYQSFYHCTVSGCLSFIFVMSQNKNQQKQLNLAISDQQLNNPRSEHSQYRQQSQYTRKYLQYFNYSDLGQYQKQHQTAVNNLKCRQRIEISQDYSSNCIIQIIAHSPNYEFIELQASLGYFKINNIMIASFNQLTRTYIVTESYSGNFCTTYRAKCFGEKYAFKSFPFKSKQKNAVDTMQLQQKSKIFRQAIKEYCLTLIASHLEIGPKVERILGYDIAIYEDCIEFAMEFCMHLKQQHLRILQKQLKQTVRIAHLYKLIHYDIKPDNICFSRKQNRIVLIDYGFSEFVEVDLGKSYPVKYKGTYFYVCKEMAYNFHSEILCPVDPYFNDLHGLQKSIQMILQQAQAQLSMMVRQADNELADENNITRLHLSKHLKCLFFNLDLQSIELLKRNKVYEQDLFQQRAKIMQFVATLNYPSKYIQFEQKKYEQYQEHNCLNKEVGSIMFIQNGEEERPASKQYGYQTLYKESLDILKEISLFDTCPGFQSEQQLLLDIQSAENVSKEQYLCLLAKALRVNTNRYSIQTRFRIAKVAYLWLNKSKAKNGSNQQPSQQKDKDQRIFYLKQVNKYLLEYSLMLPHHSRKLGIYFKVMVNIIALGVVSQEKLFDYYQQIHLLKISSEIRLITLFCFITSYEWKRWTMQSHNNYFSHIAKYKQYSRDCIRQYRNRGEDSRILQIYKLMVQIQSQPAFNNKTTPAENYQQFKNSLQVFTRDKFKRQLVRWYNYCQNIVLKDYSQPNHLYEIHLYRQLNRIEQTFDYDYFAMYRYKVSNGFYSRSAQKFNLLFRKILGQLDLHKDYVIANFEQIIKRIQLVNSAQKLTDFQQMNISFPQQDYEQQLISYFIHYSLQKYMGTPKITKLVEFYLSSPLLNQYHTSFNDLEDCKQKLILNEKNMARVNFFLILLNKQQRMQFEPKQTIRSIREVIKAQQLYFKTQQQKNKWDGSLLFYKFKMLVKLMYFLFFKRQFKHFEQLKSIILRLAFILRKTIFQKIAFNVLYLCLWLNHKSNIRVTNYSREDIFMYNYFLEQRTHFHNFFSHHFFANFLNLVQQHFGFEAFLDFYAQNIKRLGPVINRVGGYTWLCLIGILFMRTFIKQNKQNKHLFLHRVFHQISQCPQLSLVAIWFLDRPEVRNNVGYYLKIFKTIRHLPRTYGGVCLNASIIQYLSAFKNDLPQRKKQHLHRRSIKTFTICDGVQNRGYYDQIKAKLSKKTVGRWWSWGQKKFVDKLLEYIGRIKTYNFVFKLGIVIEQSGISSINGEGSI